MKAIKQFIPQEACLKCLGCCRFRDADSVWLPCLLDEEIQALLDQNAPPACISIEKKIQAVPSPRGEGFICAFFDVENNKCKIYGARPFECQLYPFIINLRNKKAVLTLDLNCPYIKENLNTKEFKEYCDYLTALLNSPSWLKALKENPQLLQAYEQVKDIIELDV